MADGVDLASRALRALRISAAVVAPVLVASPSLGLGEVQADAGQTAAPIAIHLDTNPLTAPSSVVAVGLDRRVLATLDSAGPTAEDWQRLFPIYTGAELPTDGRPPVAGKWTVEGEVLRFRPRFPFDPGLTYVTRLDLSAGPLAPVDLIPPVIATFALPAEITESSTVVSQVFPTASELPENLLRFYLHFSAPMSRGEAYAHIRLIDDQGQPANRPFLEIDEELWDPGMRRLTLFFDPGRIKRGLRPHFEAGPPLTAGTTYRLVIDAGWRDANDQPLAEGFEKTFRVTAPDRQAPNPSDWSIVAPAVASREPLELRFPEPLDHGLLQRVLHVETADGIPVIGEVRVTNGERRFRLLPQVPWRAGSYTITVETILEDIAGNNLNTVFDVDVKNSGSQVGRGRKVFELQFDVDPR